MSNIWKELELLRQEGNIVFHLLLLLVCVLIGIAASRFCFVRLRKFVVRVTGEPNVLVDRAFRGMPAVWGILAGGYAAVHAIPLSPEALHQLRSLFHVVGIFSLTIMGARLVSGFLTLQVQKSAEAFASTSILVTTVELVVYIMGFLFMLQAYDISITPLLTALGVGGVAVALALQDTLSNLFSGINILLAKQIKVGDFIRLSSGEEGTVTDLNWRNTTIRQPSDNMVVVPNQKIATSIITNYALPFAECSITVPVIVSHDSDLERVEAVTAAIAREVLRQTPGGIADFEPFIRFGGFTDTGVAFNVILRVKSVADQHLVRHEFVKRLQSRYRLEGIVIPHPVRPFQIQPPPPERPVSS